MVKPQALAAYYTFTQHYSYTQQLLEEPVGDHVCKWRFGLMRFGLMQREEG